MGTIESYDANSKSLTVKEANGTSQTFDASNANISKNVKISLADLSKLSLTNEVVQATGQKASDGTYSATALTVADPNMFAGNANGAFPGNNGTPGAGRSNGTPGAMRTRNPNVTPGVGFGGANSVNNGNNRLMLRNAVISGNQLTGTDQSGASVNVNLTDATVITRRSSGAAADLTTGQKISVNYRMDQNNNMASAVAITIEQ
jgi:hypothetical protein